MAAHNYLVVVFASIFFMGGVCAEEKAPPAQESPPEQKSLGAATLEAFDNDKDGQLSLQELLDHVQHKQDVANHPDVKGWHQGFKEADANKDMHLNAEELEFLFTNAKKQHRDELVEAIEESSKSVLEGWDTDKDGKISLMELLEHTHANAELANHPHFEGWQKGFKEADLDKDMHLDANELKGLLTHFANSEHEGHPLHDDL
jgi:Ca2+-binding EF-hand superfamily protein